MNVPQRTHVTSSVTKPFWANGTVRTTNSTQITGVTITPQNSTNNSTWHNVTNVTDANGTYQFSNNESAAGTHHYRTAYDGKVPLRKEERYHSPLHRRVRCNDTSNTTGQITLTFNQTIRAGAN